MVRAVVYWGRGVVETWLSIGGVGWGCFDGPASL